MDAMHWFLVVLATGLSAVAAAALPMSSTGSGGLFGIAFLGVMFIQFAVSQEIFGRSAALFAASVCGGLGLVLVWPGLLLIASGPWSSRLFAGWLGVVLLFLLSPLLMFILAALWYWGDGAAMPA
jgi:hypothetical protein